MTETMKKWLKELYLFGAGEHYTVAGHEALMLHKTNSDEHAEFAQMLMDMANIFEEVKRGDLNMKIYVLTIIKETKLNAEVTTTLYAKPEDAIMAYEKAMDEAQAEAEGYEDVCTDDEIATDTPYRWFSIYDEGGSYDRITIELDTKEVM